MKLAIYGTGGSGNETYDILQECIGEKSKWEEILFLDDTKEDGIYKECKRYTFESFKQLYSPENVKIVIAIGEPKAREALYEKVKKCGYSLGNVIHESARISESAQLGEGLVIQADVRISSAAQVSDNVYINHRTLVGHDVCVGKHCQISCNVALAGSVKVGEAVFIGIAVSVRDHVVIGERTILSMGSIVLKDIRPYKIVMGNPGREISENKEQSVFG